METNHPGQYAIYLRKSRSDAELEAAGGGDTLSRHRKTLLDLSRRLGLTVTQIYEEVVSGETLAARPEAQKLLSAVDQGLFSGVLVMEVERLARGDTIDQGIVAQSFKYSRTKIITPMKIYDPNNEFDEEYFEFGLFMSRREYKTINRRLQRGRETSVNEGKFVGNKPPYGYRRIKLEHDKGFTLEPIPDQAVWVLKIFQWFTVPQSYPENSPPHLLGCSAIANRLNDFGVPSFTGSVWTPPVVNEILRNPVYAGFVRWNNRATKKTVENGSVKRSRPRNPEGALIKPGLHPPIVSQELFDQAQLRLKNPSRPGPKEVEIKNPLSGVVICAKCGHAMVRRPYQSGRQASLICAYNACHGNVGSDLEDVESLLLSSLRSWADHYETELSDSPADTSSYDEALAAVEKNLLQLAEQESRAYDLVEQGIYTPDVFLSRTQTISQRREKLLSEKETLSEARQRVLDVSEARSTIVPRIRRVLDSYPQSSIREKNELLKSVLDKVEYSKTTSNRWNKGSDLQLTLYPKLPKKISF